MVFPTHPLDVPYNGIKDTQQGVKKLSLDWVIIGPIRLTQHLANVWHLTEPGAFEKDSPSTYRLNGVNVFGPNYTDHPWTLWAALSSTHYSWMYFYALDMCEEYVARMGPNVRTHGIKHMLLALENMPEALPEESWMSPDFARRIE